MCSSVLAEAQADTSGGAPFAQLVEQARAQLTKGNAESAAVLLRRVTDARARPVAERVQAEVLLGIALYYARGASDAAAAFREAFVQIGRASCRERGGIVVLGGAV